MFSSRSCGSGKVFTRVGANAPTKRPSYIGDVVRKLRTLEDYQTLSEEELTEKAVELTEPEKLWTIYFSGIALDLSREHIERSVDEERQSGDGSGAVQDLPDGFGAVPTAKIPVKLRLKPVHSAGQYGQLSFTSLLLEHYGSLHTSLLLDGKIVLAWNTSGLIIPTGKPIDSVTSASTSPTTEHYHTAEEEVQYSFDAASARKELLDKLIGIIVRYNKNYLYHPIFRSCQKFVADSVTALGYPVHRQLEGKLGDYYKEVKKGQKRKIEFDSHAKLDEYVGRVLESGGTTLPETEYLLSQYFLFHVTSMTECERPEKWVCEVKSGCLMSRLEQTVDLKDTIAYHTLRHVQS